VVGFLQIRKQLFFRLEPRRMHATPAPPQRNRMLEVKHFVVNNIFHGEAGNLWMIEDAADHNGIMGGIVMAKSVPRTVTAPGHKRTSQQAMKEPGI